MTGDDVAQIRDALGELKTCVAEMKTTQTIQHQENQAALGRISDHLDKLNNQTAKHGDRISALEGLVQFSKGVVEGSKGTLNGAILAVGVLGTIMGIVSAGVIIIHTVS